MMERFENYWGRKPYLDKVVFKIIPDDEARLIALQKGEIDIAHSLTGTAVEILKKDSRVKLHAVEESYGMQCIWFNLRNWPMNDIRLRWAIAMGVDWDKLVVAATPHGAIPAQSFLQGSWASDPKEAKRPPYDPVKAKKLVAEVVAEGGKPLPSLIAMTYEVPLYINSFEIAKTQLKEIGIDLDVKIFPWPVFFPKWSDPETSRWDLVIVPNKTELPYTSFGLLRAGLRSTKDGKNWCAYVNPKMEEVLERAVVTLDRKENTRLLQEANRMVLEDLPAFPFGRQINYTGVHQKVQDFKPHVALIAISNSWTNIWLKK